MKAINSLLLINAFTVLAFIISPFIYASENTFIAIIFLTINITCLRFGFKFGLNQSGYGNINTEYIKKIETIFLKFIFYFYLLFFMVKYSFLLKISIFEPFEMLNFLLVGLFDPQLGYAQSLLTSSKAESIHWAIGLPVFTLTGIFFPLMFLSWSSLTKTKRFFVIFFVLLEILYWLGRGTNFGFIFLLLFAVYSAAVNNSFKFNQVLIAKFFVCFFLVLFVFIFNIMARSDYELPDLNLYSMPMAEVNKNHFIFTLVSDNLQAPVVIIFSYLIQGYLNMSIAFDLPFEFTFFGGWNPTIMSWYEYFGLKVDHLTYLRKLEVLGIDEKINWHSAYTWFANDVSFYFVPAVMLFYGFLLGWSQKISLIYNSALAKITFIYLSVASILFFANTNLLSYFFFSILFCIILLVAALAIPKKKKRTIFLYPT